MPIEALLFGSPKSALIDPTASFLVQGKSFVDLSALGATPTITGSPVPAANEVESPFTNGSLEFTNGRAAYALANMLNQNFLIEVWVKFKTGFNTAWSHLLGQGNGVSAGSWAFGPSNGRPTLSVAGPSGRLIVTGTTSLVANRWYYLSAARKGSTFYVFRDGFLENTGAASYPLNANQGLLIGDRSLADAAGNYPLLGYIGGARISTGTDMVVPTASYARPTGPWLN